MVRRFYNLDYDDDGMLYGMQADHGRQNLLNVQELLQDIIFSSTDGGYDGFIEQHKLQGIIAPKQIEKLFTDPHMRMGKHLAGIMSVIVPPEYASWVQVKNLYERTDSKSEEVEVSREALNTYIHRLVETPGLEFGHILRLIRRTNLLSQDNLEKRLGMTEGTVYHYENGKNSLEVAKVHKLADTLKVDSSIRWIMLDALGKNAYEKLEDPKRWRDGLKSFTGSGSVFGGMLYHLRNNKGWSQEELGERSGVTRETINRLENSKSLPHAAALQRLADALEVTPTQRTALEDPKRWRGSLKSFADSGSAFGAMLYHLRNNKGWSQEELGERSGVTRETIYRYENGKSLPHIAALHKLADALEATPTQHTALEEAARNGRRDRRPQKDTQR